MSFSKSFPRRSDKSVYPQWEEIFLSEEEEKAVEDEYRLKHLALMKRCLEEAKQLAPDHDLHAQTIIAAALFEKQASHVVYGKEEKAREKFDG